MALAKSTSIAAPVGGWNARDPIAAMDTKYATILKNWWPQFDGVAIRYGWAKHRGSTPLGGGTPTPIESLWTYVDDDGVENLFAWAGTSNYDISASGATFPSASDTGLGDARWDAINFRTSAGAFLFCVRQAGGTAPKHYRTGAGWVAPSITGITASNIVGVYAFKRRLWFLQKDSTALAYLPVDSVAGAAEFFDPGSLLKRGGYFVAGATWTIDAGEGLDDHMVVISSEGEVVVYAGTSPINNDFRLIGVYDIGQPLGRRCLTKLGGDLILLTREGALPLSGALQSTRVRPDVAISDAIRGAFDTAAITYGANFGWAVQFWPDREMLLVNVPVGSGLQEQYVMNTQTKGWAQWTGMPGYCVAQYNGGMYFGSDGYVGQMWSGQTDNGFPISTDVQQAFSYFGSRARVKRFTMARPTFRVSPPLASQGISIGVNVDYQDIPPTYTPTYTGSGGVTTWDAGGTWDSGLMWIGDSTQAQWVGVSGVGICAALRMQLSAANTSLLWQATDFVYEVGGVL